MKKNLSKAMAAAMAVAAVAPVVAQPVVADAVGLSNDLITATESNTNEYTVNVRAINGYKLVTRDEVKSILEANSSTQGTVFSRKEAFDGNLTPEIADDVLKPIFGKDAVIVATKKGTDINLLGHKYVIGKKASQSEIAAAKLQEAKVKESIENLKTAGYTITEQVTKEEGFTATDYQEGEKVVIAKKDREEYKFIFKGIVDAKVPVSVDGLKGAFEGLKDNFKEEQETITKVVNESFTLNVSAENGTSVQVKERYYNLNSLVMFLNTNADKLDIVKYESSDRKTVTLKVYQKGLRGIDKGLVQTITLSNIHELDKDLVLGQLGKTDFAGHWAEAEIKEAMKNGWVDNSNTFRPNDSVTRAEFAKMVCTIFDIPTDKDSISSLEEPFSDVKGDAWYYNYIVALYNYNLGKDVDDNDPSTTNGTVGKGVVINGYADETFKPNAKITREEAAKMMAAAYELSAIGKDTTTTSAHTLYIKYSATTTDKGTSFKEVNIDTLLNGKVDNVLVGKDGTKIHRDVKTAFKDDKEIATWADEAVATLSKKDILGGNPDGTFKPKSQITRAEALAMVTRSAGETK